MIISEHIRNSSECHTEGDKFLIWKISNNKDFIPCFMDGETKFLFFHILIRAGSMVVRHEGNEYHIGHSCYAVFLDSYKLEIESMSDNIRAYFISLAPDYTKSITNGILPLPVSFVLKKRQTPIDKLEQHLVNLLFRRMDCLWECCMDKQHLFREEQVKHAYLMWLLDLANIYHRKEDNNHKKEAKPDRKKVLFVEFMKLLPIHAREEHSLGFYASALCVTPQYLNRVVKNYSGKTVGEWLYQTLVGLITKQLETTDDSMQKIAMDFHFVDQSALAKFYKRQTGYSLSEYKKGKVHI